jgi:hypothetical protein
LLKCQAVAIVPITKTIIDLVHVMEANDKMPEGIIIEMNSGTVEQWNSGTQLFMFPLGVQEWTMIVMTKTLKMIALSDGDNNSEESEGEENFDAMEPN